MTNLIVSSKALPVIVTALNRQLRMVEYDKTEWPADEARYYDAQYLNHTRILKNIRDLITEHGGDAYPKILDLMQDLTVCDAMSVEFLLRYFATKESTFEWRNLDHDIYFMSYPPGFTDRQLSYNRNERAKPYEYMTAWHDITTVIDRLYKTIFDLKRENSQLIVVHWSDLCTPYKYGESLSESMKIVAVQNESNETEQYIVPCNLGLLCSRVRTYTRLVILHTQIDVEPLKRILRASDDRTEVRICRPTPDGSAYNPEYFADFVQTPQEPSVPNKIEQHIEKYSAKCVQYVGSTLYPSITTEVYNMLYRLRNNTDPDALEDFAIYEV